MSTSKTATLSLAAANSSGSALVDPTRRSILEAVRTKERSVGELVDIVGMHQPGVSRHLKILRDAGLVEARREPQRRLSLAAVLAFRGLARRAGGARMRP